MKAELRIRTLEAADLPALEPALALACRALSGRRWPLALAGRRCTLSLHGPGPADAPGAVVLGFEFLGATGRLLVDPRGLGLVLAERGVERLPASLLRVLLADALDGARDALERHAGERAGWRAEPGAAPPAAAPALWFALHPEGGGAPGRVGVAFDDAGAWTRLPGAVSRVPRRPPALPRGASAWRVPVRLAVGRTTLPVADLRRVRPGDIVAVDDWTGRDGGIEAGLLAGGAGRMHWRVRIDQERISVLRRQEEHVMADAMEPGAALPADAAVPVLAHAAGAAADARDTMLLETLGRLDVELRFEIGGLAMRLDALSSLGPGYVFELPQSLTQCDVSILCHSTLLGKGQLVAVGERLGVRVTAFAATDDVQPA